MHVAIFEIFEFVREINYQDGRTDMAIYGEDTENLYLILSMQSDWMLEWENNKK